MAWRGFWSGPLALALALAAGLAQGQECRVAFDLGSSGMRAAASVLATTASPRRELDLLAPLWQQASLEPAMPQIARALQELPDSAGWPASCLRLGAGFSAWRLAWQLDAAGLTEQLRRLKDESGVAVLVMPQSTEGRLAHEAARQVLGQRLGDAHVLDLGGGSMQLTGPQSSVGDELGQKSWQRQLCLLLRGRPVCQLETLDPDELRQARQWLQLRLQGWAAQQPSRLVAISRPVTRGIAPALRRLGGAPATGGADQLSLTQVQAGLDTLAPLSLAEVIARTGAPSAHAPYLVSDLLLLEAVMRQTRMPRVDLAEADINNLPGLLRDGKAFAWTRQHACYLQRLREQGPQAYDSDPATCPGP